MKKINYQKCSFIGHRIIECNGLLLNKLWQLIEGLVENYEVYTFLFGSNSEFDDLCYNIVSQLKNKYPYIRRIHYACDENECGLKDYEEEFVNKKIVYKKAIYVERNKKMIDDSDICIIYFKEDYTPKSYLGKTLNSNSGTKIAYNYMNEKKKMLVNVAKM